MSMMNLLRNLLAKKQSESDIDTTSPSNDISPAELVEDIVKKLRQEPPSREICYVVLFGDRPLTGMAVKDETDIMCFTSRSRAEDFMRGYQNYYHCQKPLSILAVGQLSELWAMLNNKARDQLYEPPYGLLINFSYSGHPYNRYSLADLKRIGLDGLNKGFTALRP